VSALADWAVLVAQVNGRPTLGVPGVRDTSAPCHLYEPAYDAGAPRPADGYGTCSTDGHYLCRECPEMSREAAEWRDS
jgi:hypothetical protein